MLLKSRTAPAHRDARGLKLLLHPTLAKSGDEPTAAEPVEGGQPARQYDWALKEGVQHAGPQDDSAGAGRDVGQRLDRVVHRREVFRRLHDRPAGAAHRDRHSWPHQPLPGPDRVQPDTLGLLGDLSDARR
jgi:hypothetical protein